MRDLLALPATLLALIAASSASAQDHPRPADFLPEHQKHIKREQQAQEQLQWQQPIGMRKMSGDEGEKFFLHYWDFGDADADLDDYIEEAVKSANASLQLSAPMAPHFERAHTFRRFPGYSLFARDWGSCPTGTKSCTEIDRPDSCCGENDECIKVDDTGNGDVGCCPQGGSCGSSISDCDESAGQTSCPESDNKGCCIEGYACYEVGCVWASTQTTTNTLPVATVTQGQTSVEPSPEPSSTTSEETETDTVVVAGAGGSTYTTTVENTITETAPGTTSIGTVTAPTTVTVTESPPETTEETTEEPAETSTEEPEPEPTTTEETAALPPSRPTGVTEDPPPDSMTTSTSEVPDDASCPTGFYMCSAHYLGGCCRVGRNCDTTSCPTADSTELISNGVTVAGGAGNVAASTSTTTVDPDETSAASTEDAGEGESCANGWFLCDEADGGGCCPNNYVCGQSCTATVSGVDNQAKQDPSGAGAVRWAWGFFALAVGTGVGMVWL